MYDGCFDNFVETGSGVIRKTEVSHKAHQKDRGPPESASKTQAQTTGSHTQTGSQTRDIDTNGIAVNFKDPIELHCCSFFAKLMDRVCEQQNYE
jgi:hypothetical protein